MNDQKKARGRPKKEEKKNTRVTIRLSDEEARMLEDMSDYTGESKARLLTNALRISYSLTMRRW